MKRVYEDPRITFVPFNHQDRIASSGEAPICYPIYSNVDKTSDNICDTDPVYVGKTN